MADGIKVGGVEVYADWLTSGLRFTFIRGGLQSLPSYRGEDDVVPGASGRDPGQWTADTRDVVLHGLVAGTSRTNFRTRADTLLAVMDPTSTVTIVAYPPHFGLSTGETATLSSVRPMSITGPDPSANWYEGWEVTLEFVCIDSPPDWVLGT